MHANKHEDILTMNGKAQLWFKTRQLCGFVHLYEQCLKILAKKYNICLTKEWQGVGSNSVLMQKLWISPFDQDALALRTASIIKKTASPVNVLSHAYCTEAFTI